MRNEESETENGNENETEGGTEEGNGNDASGIAFADTIEKNLLPWQKKCKQGKCKALPKSMLLKLKV